MLSKFQLITLFLFITLPSKWTHTLKNDANTYRNASILITPFSYTNPPHLMLAASQYWFTRLNLWTHLVIDFAGDSDCPPQFPIKNPPSVYTTLQGCMVDPPFHSDSLLSQWHTHEYLDKTGRCWSRDVAPDCPEIWSICKPPDHQLFYLPLSGVAGTLPPCSHDCLRWHKREETRRKIGLLAACPLTTNNKGNALYETILQNNQLWI